MYNVREVCQLVCKQLCMYDTHFHRSTYTLRDKDEGEHSWTFEAQLTN